MTLRLIAGKFKGRILKTPATASTRPTQGMLREAIFNICQQEIQGADFLDLFAGSGAMGLEAISRGARHATFVEKMRAPLSCIKENIALLEVESQTTLLPMDAKQAVNHLVQKQTSFDLIYVDPPYEIPFDLSQLLPLLKPTGTLFLEERYTPHQPHAIPHYPGLELKSTRRFGQAWVSIFYHKEII
jgi:16S rRNA (guanine(966)-N(2))-methyltransferase RsmD